MAANLLIKTQVQLLLESKADATNQALNRAIGVSNIPVRYKNSRRESHDARNDLTFDVPKRVHSIFRLLPEHN